MQQTNLKRHISKYVKAKYCFNTLYGQMFVLFNFFPKSCSDAVHYLPFLYDKKYKK